MALFRRSAFEKIELTEIHRFRDPEWADLSARLRYANGAAETQEVAVQLIRNGHVRTASSEVEAHQMMVDEWLRAARRGESIALVTATQAEAQAIGEAIQARRIEFGEVDVHRSATGQSGQTILVGDLVQTRRNDNASGVENRQGWVVNNISQTHLTLVSTSDSSNLRRVTIDYASSHLHLGYASTVYGIQGETMERSIVGPGVDAAGLYVGLTRGRTANEVVVVASSTNSATAELAATMQRKPTEETLQKSRAAARQELMRSVRMDQLQGSPINTAVTSSLAR
jgi:hypothetical protein